ATLGTEWTIYAEGTTSRPLVDVLHEEERDAAEMVAVQVRHEHEVDAAGVVLSGFQRLEDGRTAIDQERHARALDHVGAVQASTRAEGVARAEHRHADQRRPLFRPHSRARRVKSAPA